MSDDKNDRDSLTARQIAVLAGRNLPELTARERLEYTNAAPRPTPLNQYPARDEFRFHFDHEKLAEVGPNVRLRVANGAPLLERMRQRIAELALAESSASRIEVEVLRSERSQISSAASSLFSDIGVFEKDRSA